MEHYTVLDDFNIFMLFKKIGKKSKTNHDGEKIVYYNTAITFDTETTSCYHNNNKVAYCYIWQVCMQGQCFYGRTLDEFVIFVEQIQRVLKLSAAQRLLCYVHFLDFDFQFIRKYFNWIDLFARTERKPLYACTENGIEFRCSYMLTLLPLAKLPEQIPNYQLKKLLGNLNYDLPRHSETPLTPAELDYCEADVLILFDFIMYEKKNNQNNITKIPLTKTGYIRKRVKRALQENRSFWYAYSNRLKQCQPTPELFTLLNKSFQGGYVHANSRYSGIVLDNVNSVDFASSYPSVMVNELFPWRFKKIVITNIEMFNKYISKYACVFEISFEGLQAKTTTTILSSSKCEYLENSQVDNGRIISADVAMTYLTELDYQSMTEFYTWNEIIIGTFYYAEYERLPKPFIDVVLQAYSEKTILKGVIGKEREYQVSKGIVNGTYGMTVTNPVCETITYNDEWDSIAPDLIQSLIENKDRNFLLYQWGVWVSAHARRKLLSVVSQIETSVVYCDTDSIKFVDNEFALKVINEYNEQQEKKFRETAEFYKYKIPKTSNGELALLGVFDFEGKYDKFKTLGAKRYVCSKDGKFSITIAGLSKKCGAEYINNHGGFDFFNDGMSIPPENSGKKEHTYIDDSVMFEMTDYLGNTCKCYAPSGVHLSPIGFTMDLSKYVEYFTHIQESITGLEIDHKSIPELTIGAETLLKSIRGDYN